MSYQHDRDQFLVQVGQDLGLDTATKLLRHATTLQRLAVAQCNGDYPCDNGERKVIPCPLCESQYVPSQIKGGKLARAAWVRMAEQERTCGAKGKNAICRDAVVEGTEHRAKAGPACPDCRTEAAIRLLLHGSPYQAVTGGDPRGYVLKLYDTNTIPIAIDNGTAFSIGVPVRER